MSRVTEGRVHGYHDDGRKSSHLAISVCVCVMVMVMVLGIVLSWSEVCGVLRLEACLSPVANRNRMCRICNGRSFVTINGSIFVLWLSFVQLQQS